MDASVLSIAIFLSATFTAALVTRFAAFAFGLAAAAVWLHVLSPLQTATLIIAFGLWCRASQYGNCVRLCAGAGCGHFSSARPWVYR
jgi:hypothetical protein